MGAHRENPNRFSSLGIQPKESGSGVFNLKDRQKQRENRKVWRKKAGMEAIQ